MFIQLSNIKDPNRNRNNNSTPIDHDNLDMSIDPSVYSHNASFNEPSYPEFNSHNNANSNRSNSNSYPDFNPNRSESSEQFYKKPKRTLASLRQARQPRTPLDRSSFLKKRREQSLNNNQNVPPITGSYIRNPSAKRRGGLVKVRRHNISNR